MRIIIDGAGEVGSHLAKMLRSEGNSVAVIDNDRSRLTRLGSYADVEIIEGNPSSIDVLREAGAQDADLFIAVFPFTSQEVNIVAAVLAKHLGTAKVIARVNDEDCIKPENLQVYKDMGIELLSYPERGAADEIVEQLHHSATSETMEFARGQLQIAAFNIDERSPIMDYKLSEFMAQLKDGEVEQFRVIAIARDGKTIIPKSDTKFFFGDLVFTISKRDGVDALAGYFGKKKVEVEKVMILGGGAVASMVASTLVRQGIKVKIIEADKNRCLELSQKLSEDVMIVNGDGRNSDFLFEEGIGDYDAFVAVTPGDEANVLACVVARKFGVPRTIAEVENIEYMHLAEELGVDCVINKKMIMAGRIFKYTLGDKARFVKYMGGTDAEVVEYTVAPGSLVTKGELRDVGFPDNAIVGGVIRGNESFIAVGSTRIEAYDRVAVFALPQSIKSIDKFFN